MLTNEDLIDDETLGGGEERALMFVPEWNPKTGRVVSWLLIHYSPNGLTILDSCIPKSDLFDLGEGECNA
jgi:hypothetical protein